MIDTAPEGIVPSGAAGGSGGRLRRPGAAAGQGREGATGHRRQEDDRRAVADRGLEAVARAHVLAVDVDVDERLQLAVL